MSTVATRKAVIPGAAPEVEAAPAAPSDAFPKADQAQSDVERIALLEARVAYLLQTVRQLVKDVKALNPIGDAAVKTEKVMLPPDEAIAEARRTGKFVLSTEGYVGPLS